MGAKSDPGLPGPMDGAPKRAGHKGAPTQAPRHSASANGPSDPGKSVSKNRPAPAVKTRGTNRGAR
jgi:hypothetical protein